MTKRWVDQFMFDRPWFRGLEPRLKCFWLFLICKADLCGVVIVDYALASFQIGEKVGPEDLAAFEDNVKVIGGVKVLLTKFVDFQFGKFDTSQTKTKSRVQKAVMDRMRWNGLVPDDQVVKLTGTRWDKKKNRVVKRLEEAGIEIDADVLDGLKDVYRGVDFGKLVEAAIAEHKERPIVDAAGWFKEAARVASEGGGEKTPEQSPLMLRIGGWFNRRPSTSWSAKEKKALAALGDPPPEIEIIESWYGKPAMKEDYRRKDILTLLNNWNGEIDRAKTRQAEPEKYRGPNI